MKRPQLVIQPVADLVSSCEITVAGTPHEFVAVHVGTLQYCEARDDWSEEQVATSDEF